MVRWSDCDRFSQYTGEVVAKYFHCVQSGQSGHEGYYVNAHNGRIQS